MYVVNGLGITCCNNNFPIANQIVDYIILELAPLLRDYKCKTAI